MRPLRCLYTATVIRHGFGRISRAEQALESAHNACGLQVLRMVDNQHYLYRMTVLVAIASLAPAVHHDVLCSSMLPVVIGCSKDRVR